MKRETFEKLIRERAKLSENEAYLLSTILNVDGSGTVKYSQLKKWMKMDDESGGGSRRRCSTTSSGDGSEGENNLSSRGKKKKKKSVPWLLNQMKAVNAL